MTFLALLAFAAIFLIDLQNLKRLPDRKKFFAVYLVLLALGFLLSVLQIFKLLPSL